MEEKYSISVDTYESTDVSGHYAWRIEDINGFKVRKGLEKTPLLGFAKAMEALEDIKTV